MPAATPVTVQFGGHGNGCRPTDVEVFTPLCAVDPIAGSAPLVLDVPVPAPAPFIPPAADCACFTFTPGEDETTVAPTCTPGDKATLSLTVEVVQANPADCCTGLYRINPTVSLELPCIPFELGEGEATACGADREVKPGDTDGVAGRGQDGRITSFGLRRGTAPGGTDGSDSPDSSDEADENCCTVTPYIGIEFPECVKYYKKLPATQVTYCDNGATKNHTLVKWVQDEEHCSSYPEILPLTLPECALGDDPGTLQQATIRNSNTNTSIGTLTWKVSRTNCDVGVHINDISLNIPMPGGGAGFGNGGDVGLAGGMLYIDGDENSNADTYWGGGYGDWFRSGCYNVPNCRGPSMRGVTAQQGDPADNWVPHASVNTVQFVVSGSGCSGTNPCVTDGGTGDCAVKTANSWSSGYLRTTNNTTTHTAGSGNLNMIWPTGVQWHTDKLSVALPLTEFLYNPAGVLSKAKETKKAVLLAPGPAVTKQYSDTRLSLVAGRNASGLISQPKDNNEADVITNGLRINCGDGLRIYGDGGMDVATDDDGGGSIHGGTGYNLNRQGVLELKYGPGLRMVSSVDSGGNATAYRNYPVTLPGAVTVNAHSKDLTFTPANDTGGKYRLVLNDADTNDVIAVNQVTTVNPSITGGVLNTYTRDSDFTVPAVMFFTERGNAGKGDIAVSIPPEAWYANPLTPIAPADKNNDQEYNLTLWADAGSSGYGVYPEWTGQVSGWLGNAYIRYGRDPDEDPYALLSTMYAALLAIVGTLRLMRGTYLHFGQAGMLMASDGNTDCTSVTRHSAGTQPAQSGS